MYRVVANYSYAFLVRVPAKPPCKFGQLFQFFLVFGILSPNKRLNQDWLVQQVYAIV